MTDTDTTQTSTGIPTRPPRTRSWPILLWGILLSCIAFGVIAAGATSQSSDTGGANVTEVVGGGLIGIIGASLLLVGTIAVGTRIGLRDHELLREWENGG